MMKHLALCFAIILSFSSNAQSMQELFDQKEFTAILGSIDTIADSPIEDIHLFARSAHALRRDSLSASVLKGVIESGRGNATTRFELGRSYYGFGKPDKAAKWFREARKSNPDMLLAYLAEADAYTVSRRLDSAMTVYQLTVDHFDDRGIALAMTCILPTEEGYIDSAVHCWEQNLDRFDQVRFNEMARQQLATLYWEYTGDTLAAADMMNELIEFQPKLTSYRLQSIQIHSELNDWDEVENQIATIRSWADAGELSSFYMERNAIPLLTVKGENFDVQLFEIIEYRPNSEEFSAKWSAYLTTPLHGRLVGHIRYYENADEPYLKTDIQRLNLQPIEAPLSIEEFVQYLKQMESNLH